MSSHSPVVRIRKPACLFGNAGASCNKRPTFLDSFPLTFVSTIMSLQNCTVAFEVENHSLYPDSVQVVVAVLRGPKNQEIAHLQGWLIDRWRARSSYFERMILSGKDQGQSAIIAYRRLFDKWGRIRPWLVRNDYLKGLGTWGEELNEGKLLYIGDVCLKQGHYSAIVESYLLGALLGSRYLGPKDFAFTLLDLNRYELFEQHHFRRVGFVEVLAYSKDPLHHSRRLHVEDDVVPAAYVHHPTCGISVAEHDKLDADGHQRHRLRAHPIHAVLANAAHYPDEKLDKTIRALCHLRPSLLHEQDDIGLTPIHLAARLKVTQAVRTLLLLGAAVDLNRRDNCEGWTVLETCSSEMLKNREYQEILSEYRGNDKAYLRIIWLIKQALNWPGFAESEEAYIAVKQWGCTCRQCADGWYSKRMRWTLMCQSSLIAAERPQIPTSSFDKHGFLPLETVVIDVTLDHLPFKFRVRLSKAFYQGYRACLQAITDFFGETSDDTVPTCAAIITSIRKGMLLGPRQTQAAVYFLSNGGRLEHAVDCVIWHALQLRSNVLDLAPHAIPGSPCKNDTEFELVRQKMCPGFRPKVWGPYTEKSDFMLQIDEPSKVINTMKSKGTCDH
ncbi:hypothetical protein EVG20_g11291 [Dentipellis fragilis]|uniref:Uncharacterized protein n=1 Tax=Dentipellis fragilis TaxID=205917 RepID=A0A4Y9XNR0_9AGAM|nr:hypothetical protein EVG20_g11291 [Dentipellis fragilis]